MPVVLTNKLGLPEAIVNAIRNDGYTRGASDISVTGLIAPPFQRRLMQRVDTIEDVSQRIYAVLGQGVHTLLERAYTEEKDCFVERRLFMPCEGWTVSGQLDVYERGVIRDWKITSTYSREGKREWVEQLNLLRLLCVENGHPVHALQILCIFRDWNKSKVGEFDYPPAQVGVIDVPLWTLEEARAFMAERVRLHQMEDPPACSDDERWFSGNRWAVMKKGRKRAVRVLDSEEDARARVEAEGKDHYIEYRQGEYRRCNGYCSVAHACPVMNDTPF